jgi:hypothetical protein
VCVGECDVRVVLSGWSRRAERSSSLSVTVVATAAEALVDRAIELDHVGGVCGANNKPTHFICLILKMLQIQPEKDIIIEFIRNEDYKCVATRAAARVVAIMRHAHTWYTRTRGLTECDDDICRVRCARCVNDATHTHTHIVVSWSVPVSCAGTCARWAPSTCVSSAARWTSTTTWSRC